MILRYEFDTLWMWGYDFDMVWYGFGYGLDLANMVLDMIWYGLIRFWYDFDIVFWRFRWVGLKKGNRIRAGTGFWSISPRFLGFDMFWYDFEAMLIWFWYVFKFCSQFWPISKSLLKPCQNHDCITRPQTNHNNTSHLNRCKTSILELEASDVIGYCVFWDILGEKNTRVTLILAVDKKVLETSRPELSPMVSQKHPQTILTPWI